MIIYGALLKLTKYT